MRFNSSIWHALWVLAPIGGIVFCIAWHSVEKDLWYFFDPKHGKDPRLKEAGDFAPHMQRYQDLSKLAITLSAGAIAFLVNTLVGQKPPVSDFVKNVEGVAPIVIGFFGATVALLVCFMLFQTLLYEQYCHSPTHSSYSAEKYASTICLGVTGSLSFLLAFVWLAANLFS